MFEYRVFGGCVRSDIEFPGLPKACEGGPTWTLRCTSTGPVPSESQLLGEDEVDVGVSVRLYRDARGGFRLAFDDTGTFDVSPDGSLIHWYPGPAASIQAARLDFLGRVLPLAHHQQGVLSLHASAVALSDRGVLAFLAPKYHGKSTLALALVSAGAKLVTDDTLAIELGPPAQVLPGVHQLRLREDSARQIGAPSGSVGRAPDGKFLVSDLEADQCVQSKAPLQAIYLLSPSLPDPDGIVRRRKLPSTQAVLSLVRNAKLGPLLRKAEAVSLLNSATTLAESIPVYTLRLDRGFQRLGAVVTQLQKWHAEPATADAGPTPDR